MNRKLAVVYGPEGEEYPSRLPVNTIYSVGDKIYMEYDYEKDDQVLKGIAQFEIQHIGVNTAVTPHVTVFKLSTDDAFLQSRNPEFLDYLYAEDYLEKNIVKNTELLNQVVYDLKQEGTASVPLDNDRFLFVTTLKDQYHVKLYASEAEIDAGRFKDTNHVIYQEAGENSLEFLYNSLQTMLQYDRAYELSKEVLSYENKKLTYITNGVGEFNISVPDKYINWYQSLGEPLSSYMYLVQRSDGNVGVLLNMEFDRDEIMDVYSITNNEVSEWIQHSAEELNRNLSSRFPVQVYCGAETGFEGCGEVGVFIPFGLSPDAVKEIITFIDENLNIEPEEQKEMEKHTTVNPYAYVMQKPEGADYVVVQNASGEQIRLNMMEFWEVVKMGERMNIRDEVKNYLLDMDLFYNIPVPTEILLKNEGVLNLVVEEIRNIRIEAENSDQIFKGLYHKNEEIAKLIFEDVLDEVDYYIDENEVYYGMKGEDIQNSRKAMETLTNAILSSRCEDDDSFSDVVYHQIFNCEKELKQILCADKKHSLDEKIKNADHRAGAGFAKNENPSLKHSLEREQEERL